jgi:hypothetical protein
VAAAILTQGLTTIRDALKTSFSPQIGLSDDSVAFSAAQTTLNPTGGTTVTLIQASTHANVNATTWTSTVTVNGTTQLTGKNIYTIGACLTSAATSAQSRTVRTNPIGVQAGDLFTIGIQGAVTDQS